MIESSSLMQSFPAVQTDDDGAGKLLLQARGRVATSMSPRIRYESRISMKNVSYFFCLLQNTKPLLKK